MCIETKDIIEQSGKSLFVVAMGMKQLGTSSKQYDRKKPEEETEQCSKVVQYLVTHVICLTNSYPWLVFWVFWEVIGSGDRLVTSRVD